VHPTGGSRRVFRQFAWLGVGSVKVALSCPTHQRVTRAVGRVFWFLSNVINNPYGIPERVYYHCAEQPLSSDVRRSYEYESSQFFYQRSPFVWFYCSWNPLDSFGDALDQAGSGRLQPANRVSARGTFGGRACGRARSWGFVFQHHYSSKQLDAQVVLNKFEREQAWADIDELQARVGEILQEKKPDEAYVRTLHDEDLFNFCKLFIMEKSKYFNQKLVEYENEINLRAMLVLPLIAYAVAWAYYFDFQLQPVFFSVVLLIVALLLARGIYPARCAERKSAFEMYLLLETDQKHQDGSLQSGSEE